RVAIGCIVPYDECVVRPGVWRAAPAKQACLEPHMNYDPKAFWEERLGEHFDLTGTGETRLSLADNPASYAVPLGEADNATALASAQVTLEGARVLDVGCGTGFFTDFYRQRGARVTGLDITSASVERLRAKYPDSRFILADVSDAPLDETFDVVHAFDVLYHI